MLTKRKIMSVILCNNADNYDYNSYHYLSATITSSVHFKWMYIIILIKQNHPWVQLCVSCAKTWWVLIIIFQFALLDALKKSSRIYEHHDWMTVLESFFSSISALSISLWLFLCLWFMRRNMFTKDLFHFICDKYCESICFVLERIKNLQSWERSLLFLR